MNFSYANDSLWKVSLSEKDLRDFHSPYLGNGTIGVRIAPTVFTSFDECHFLFLSKEGYDAHQMQVLPAFNCLRITMDGTEYALKTGEHQISQELDLRTGLISMADTWTYAPGKSAKIGASMLVSQEFSKLACLNLNISGAPAGTTVSFGIESDLNTTDPEAYDGIDYHLIGHHGSWCRNTFDMNFHAEDHRLVGAYTGKSDGLKFRQIVRWDDHGGHPCHSCCTDVNAINTLTFTDSLELTLFAYFGIDNAEFQACYENSTGLSAADLVESNRKAWKKIWDKALAFEAAGDAFAKEVLIYQFYLFQSLGSAAQPTGCLGLTFPGWNGAQLWDADLWILRGALPIAPEMARPIIQYRRNSLDAAKANAAAHGYAGGWYPWQADNFGRALNFPKEYLHELHNNIWVGLAPYAYYQETNDLDFLRETGYPVMEAVSDFFCSWAQKDEKGVYHIHDVIGPDECLAEVYGITVSDHFLTNVGVRSLLKAAGECAELLGLPVHPLWKEVGETLFVPEADENGIFPEYVGYNGHATKQADTIIAFYPLDYPCSGEQCMKNVDYYHEKAVHGAPLMTCQIEAILEMRCRSKEIGLQHLLERFHEYVRGAYCIPYECIQNKNSIMLTGIGGLLQALIFGYYDYELGGEDTFPRVGSLQ